MDVVSLFALAIGVCSLLLLIDWLVLPRVCVFEVKNARSLKAWRRSQVIGVALVPFWLALIVLVNMLFGANVVDVIFLRIMSAVTGSFVWLSIRWIRHFTSIKDQAIAEHLIADAIRSRRGGSIG